MQKWLSESAPLPVSERWYAEWRELHLFTFLSPRTRGRADSRPVVLPVSMFCRNHHFCRNCGWNAEEEVFFFFLRIRINSHYLPPEEKMKTRVGWLSSTAPSSSAALISSLLSKTKSRAVPNRCSRRWQTGGSWVFLCSFLPVSGFSLVLWICLTVTFDGFMCLHLEPSEHVSVWMRVRSCGTPWRQKK